MLYNILLFSGVSPVTKCVPGTCTFIYIIFKIIFPLYTSLSADTFANVANVANVVPTIKTYSFFFDYNSFGRYIFSASAAVWSQVKLQKRVVCYIETEHNNILYSYNYHPIPWVRVAKILCSVSI